MGPMGRIYLSHLSYRSYLSHFPYGCTRLNSMFTS